MNDLSHPRLIAGIVVAIIVVAVAWILISIARWRRITWRDHMDTPISAMSAEARDSGPWAIWKVFTSHEEVASPSLVLLRISNSGLRAIAKADVRRALTFTFPHRVVKEFTVTDCRGVSRQEIQPPGDLNSPQGTQNTISLPSFAMRRRAGFKLLVLLSGPGRGIVVNGKLRRGQVLHGSRARGPLSQNIAFGTVLVLLIGIQAGITFSQAPALPGYCVGGSLALKGSTAFAPTAAAIARSYTASCPDATISVSAISTFSGLNAVEAQVGAARAANAAAGPGAGPTQMAMSDGPAPAGYPGLVQHPVAVILFELVVNSFAKTDSLTTDQIKAIWKGDITNWKQVGGADLPISIIARTTTSGTRRTFDRQVLGQPEPPFSSYDCIHKNAPQSDVPFLRCEVADTDTLLQKVNTIKGAIGYAQVSDASPLTYKSIQAVKIDGAQASYDMAKANLYHYWTVETLYTAGPSAFGTLEDSFLTYLTSKAADDVLRTDDYTPCVDGDEDLRATMCQEATDT